jgi:hypothetical protein
MNSLAAEDVVEPGFDIFVFPDDALAGTECVLTVIGSASLDTTTKRGAGVVLVQ